MRGCVASAVVDWGGAELIVGGDAELVVGGDAEFDSGCGARAKCRLRSSSLDTVARSVLRTA